MSSHSRIKKSVFMCCVRYAHNWTDIFDRIVNTEVYMNIF
jgi:hypothetical protein